MMTLKQQLIQISDAGFSRIPKAIAQVLLDGIKEVRLSNLKKNALKKGDYVPDLEVLNSFGISTSIQELVTHKLLIINFYRGGWCPYCNTELRAYEKLKEDFAELGAGIVAISAETPEITIQTSNKNHLSFPVLSDQNAKLMKAFGIVFQLNKKLREEYTNFGINLSEIHDNSNYELPVPAIYVINKDLEIVYDYFEENHMLRLEPKDLLNVLKDEISTLYIK
ncbi:peroxiredoxin-like family protein [Aquimarina sp. AU119]|uniref:peroxiredoxin-like family protein n=1 Tax=Aquimarina sp. AU119 TaxID=2108528 RepID=UPI000D6892FE|nr:peroxiredoxin-like family protein [Aquimarina sp. AU119]